MTVMDEECPNVIGVDIGCGMYTVRLEYVPCVSVTCKCKLYG